MDISGSQTRVQAFGTDGRPTRSISPHKRRSIILPAHTQFSILSPNALSTPARGPSPEHDAQGSGEPDILTALAAQERLVLELKESLQKAEERLLQLRKQWATHESMKRRNESRRMHQMKPLTSSPGKKTNQAKTTSLVDDPDGSSAWMYEEMERRKALLGNARSSHRRVFSGSREAKTLALLSPINIANDIPAAPTSTKSKDERKSRDPVKRNSSPLQANKPAASVSTDDVRLEPDNHRSDSRSPQREALLQTGKQMATDLRDGLWTFFEDLRQVAVGDDIRTPEPSGRPTTTPQIKSGRKLGTKNTKLSQEPSSPIMATEAGDAFWKEQGLPEPTPLSAPTTPKRLPKVRSTSHKAQLDLNATTPDNSWEAWGSPASSVDTTKRLSATFSLASHDPDNVSLSSSMDAANRIVEDKDKAKLKPRDAIPWPELTKLAPGNLKKTASQLMAELERSLTPSPRGAGDVDDNEQYFVDHGLMH